MSSEEAYLGSPADIPVARRDGSARRRRGRQSIGVGADVSWSEEKLAEQLAFRSRAIEHLAQIGEAPVDVLSDLLADPASLQWLPRTLSAERQCALVEATERHIATVLLDRGFKVVRRRHGSIKGLSEAQSKTIYVRPAEHQLFKAVDHGSPVTLAMSLDPRRFAKSLIQNYGGGERFTSIFVWTIGSGIYRVQGQPPHAEYRELVQPSIEEPEKRVERDESIGRDGSPIELVLARLMSSQLSPLEMLDVRLSELCSDASPERFSKIMQTLIERSCTDALYIMLDAHAFLDSDVGRDHFVQLRNASAIRDASIRLRRAGTNTRIVLLGMPFSPPAGTASEVNIVELPLPNDRELLLQLRSKLGSFLGRWSSQPPTSDEFAVTEALVRLVNESAGMTQSDLATALRSISAVSNTSLGDACDLIQRVKRSIIRRSPALEIIDVEQARLPDLGAMEIFTSWLQRRRNVFLQPERARSYGIDAVPKGVLLLGIPGTGKSLAAKLTARLWEVPLLRLDLGAVRNKLVGSSEQRIRDALSIVEASSPCVLWIDEIDKGTSQDDSNAHATDLNIRATLLTWMQEHRSPVFIVATANRYESLPPELTRAGRFDARFFFGCPDADGRRDILKIHLQAKGISTVREDDPGYDDLIRCTHGFTGAELEQLVLDSMYAAFEQKERQVTMADLLDRASTIKPIVKSVGKGLEEAWALIDQGRVELASRKFLERSELLMLIDPSLYGPMYCRKERIAGWEQYAGRAERLLMSSPSGGYVAVVLDAGESEWMYIHTNIRYAATDMHDYKVLDSVKAIAHNNLFEHLLVDYGVDSFVFDDERFKAFFCGHKAFEQYKDFARMARDPKFHRFVR